MPSPTALSGTVVVELGSRAAVAICGSLLAQLGATVIVVEPAGGSRPRDAGNAHYMAGKLSLGTSSHAADSALLSSLTSFCDVVLCSSDVDGARATPGTTPPANIVCDITAFGTTGPQAGRPATEQQIQAMSGVMDTTGLPDGPPLPIAIPVVSYSAATYSAAAVLAALRVKRLRGSGQFIEVAMFDAAFVSLHAIFAGDGNGNWGARLGNRHPTVVPWNQFETEDGRVLICAGSQGQWQRLCRLIRHPQLATKFATAGQRVRGVDEIEMAIAAWTKTMRSDACIDTLIAAGIAAGPIATIDLHPIEPNLAHRQMVHRVRCGAKPVFIPGSPLALRRTPPVQPVSVPSRDADRIAVEQVVARLLTRPPTTPVAPHLQRPLAGVRVVEIGQYTAGPLCGRHLAHLGAEVIKVEKPGGDESRAFGIRQGDRSAAYCLNNADKSSLVLDLQRTEDVGLLRSLLSTADILLENLKPGALAKFGLSPAAVSDLNSRLVYCAISGFGADSIYGDRPGFDTVIQAMSGVMTAVNPGGTPLKTGASTADMMGSQVGLVAVLGALEHRDRSGEGQFIDLSMQDIGFWLTAPLWNLDLSRYQASAVVACADGHVLAGTDAATLNALAKDRGHSIADFAKCDRDQIESILMSLGLPAASVRSVAEATRLPQTVARGLKFMMPADGCDWPMLASPLGLHLTPPRIERAAPGLDQQGIAIRRELAACRLASRSRQHRRNDISRASRP